MLFFKWKRKDYTAPGSSKYDIILQDSIVKKKKKNTTSNAPEWTGSKLSTAQFPWKCN